MQERITWRPVTFLHPFSLAGVDGMQGPGTYDVQTIEELIDGLSFAAYRRVSTSISLVSHTSGLMSRQMVEIDPEDLAVAEKRDAAH